MTTDRYTGLDAALFKASIRLDMESFTLCRVGVPLSVIVTKDPYRHERITDSPTTSTTAVAPPAPMTRQQRRAAERAAAKAPRWRK